MKNSIKKLLVAALGLTIISGSTFANGVENVATKSEANFTILKEVKSISKLVVSGNVSVNLIQAPTEGVKVFDKYYSKNALVQQKDGTLRISSFDKEPLQVTVYVKNLTEIEVNDNAVVKTDGKINLLSLDVVLKDKAKAEIDANTVSLFTSVKDGAELKLSGKAEDYKGVLTSTANVITDNFTTSVSAVRSVAAYNAKVKLAATTLDDIAYPIDLLN